MGDLNLQNTTLRQHEPGFRPHACSKWSGCFGGPTSLWKQPAATKQPSHSPEGSPLITDQLCPGWIHHVFTLQPQKTQDAVARIYASPKNIRKRLESQPKRGGKPCYPAAKVRPPACHSGIEPSAQVFSSHPDGKRSADYGPDRPSPETPPRASTGKTARASPSCRLQHSSRR